MVLISRRWDENKDRVWYDKFKENMTMTTDPDEPGCDGGLPLSERLDRDHRPDKETPESHQVWVWLWKDPPRWEIRGTGALF